MKVCSNPDPVCLASLSGNFFTSHALVGDLKAPEWIEFLPWQALTRTFSNYVLCRHWLAHGAQRFFCSRCVLASVPQTTHQLLGFLCLWAVVTVTGLAPLTMVDFNRGLWWCWWAVHRWWSGLYPCCQLTDEIGAASCACTLPQVTVASAMEDLESMAGRTSPARCRVSCGRGLNEFPVGYPISLPSKTSTRMRHRYLGAVTLQTYRLRNHAVISVLINVAQKFENAVQPVVE